MSSRAALFAILTAVGLTAGVISATSAAARPVIGRGRTAFYVSPSGSDSGPGSNDDPFRTLARAQQAVRDVNTDMRKDITVNLAGGTYRLTSPLTFTAADSGTNGHQVIWQALPGQTPVLSGGDQISGWHQVDTVHHIWSASVPADLDTRQLYVNGTRAQRARSTGGLPAGSAVTSTGFTVPGNALQAVRNPADLEFVFHPLNWVQQRCDAASISGSSTQTLITMKQPCWDTVESFYAGGYPAGLPEYLENDYSFLDQPGEWYLDRSAHQIYYIPRPGQTMPTATVVAPTLQNLLIGAGTPAAPIHDMTFRGLTFGYTTWLQPGQDKGFPEIQADLMLGSPDSAYHWSPATFVTPTGGQTWNGIPYGSSAVMTPDAVEFHTARHVQVIRNTFTHLGAAGLGLDNGSQHDSIIGNTFDDISGNGLQVGSVAHPNQTNANLIDEANTITNNYVHNVAAEYQGGVGMFFGYVRDTTIAHNEVADLPYTGISLGWGWGSLDTLPSIQRNNHVTDNYIHDVMQTLFDGGGIYSLGPQPGGIMSGNYIRNVVHDNGSLYLDQGSSGWGLNNNVIEHGGYWLRNNPNSWDPSDMTATHNYTDTPTASIGHVAVTDTTVTSTGALPASIIHAAGLEAAFADLHPTTPPNDSQPPAAPAAPKGDFLSPTAIHLTWSATEDNVGVTGYEVDVNGKLAGVTEATAAREFTVTGLTANATYQFTIEARDAAANLSASSPVLTVQMPPPDTQPPAAPQAPTATAAYPTAVNLSWPATTDNWGVTGYLVYRDDVLVQTTTHTSTTITGNTGGQTYQFTIRAQDAAGNVSAPSPAVSVTIPDLPNLALHAPASALFLDGSPAVMQPNSIPAYAVDGDPSTVAQASDQYVWQLQIDLGSAQTIGWVVTQMPTDHYATQYNIAISNDGQNWTVARSVTGSNGGISAQHFGTPISARYLRIIAVKPDGPGQPGGQMGISELQVYGT